MIKEGQNVDGQDFSDTLKRQAAAQEIYSYLQAKKDTAVLTSFGNGRVTFSSSNRTIEIRLNPHKDRSFQELCLERGFSIKEIRKGIIILIEQTPKRSLRHATIANGKIHAIEIQDRPVDVDLTQEELDAIHVVATLSVIPGRILDIFGSFESFKSMIENPDMTGITTTNPTGNGLYDAGLHSYIEGVNLMRKGKMDESTSARRTVMGTSPTDRSSYYKRVIAEINAINEARQTSR